MEFNRLAAILVRNALRIKENEVIEVTLTGERKYMDFLDEFTLEVSKSGAFPTIRLQNPTYRKRFLKEVPEKYLGQTPPQMLKWIKDIHRHINIVTDAPDASFPDVPKTRLRTAHEARRPIVEKINQRSRSTVYLPTTELARHFKVPMKTFSDTLWSSLEIDYEKLRKQCKRFVDLLKSAKTRVEVLTGHDECRLEFKIGTRSIYIEDGSWTLPAGSVFVSPMETSIQGEVLFERLHIKGKVVKNLHLEIRNGQIASSSADENLSLFTQRLDGAYGDKDKIAGFGIGLNPGISSIIGCDITDVRCLGSVHVSIGSNLIFGGENFSDLFWNLIDSSASVRIDGVSIIERGQILERTPAAPVSGS